MVINALSNTLFRLRLITMLFSLFGSSAFVTLFLSYYGHKVSFFSIDCTLGEYVHNLSTSCLVLKNYRGLYMGFSAFSRALHFNVLLVRKLIIYNFFNVSSTPVSSWRRRLSSSKIRCSKFLKLRGRVRWQIW